MATMPSGLTIAIILAFIGVGLYFATLPVPEKLQNPWTLRGMAAVNFLTSQIPISWKCFILKTIRGDYFQGVTRNITDTHFDGVPVRIYQPLDKPQSSLPAIVYFHGGGWVRWDVDFFHGPLTSFSTQIDQVVLVSVEYRRAPEHIFPAAIDDCTDATLYLIRHAKEYQVDANRVAVMGDSAGGNLAAAVSQRLTFDSKYKDVPKLKLQGLIYPCLQAFDLNLPSYQQHGHHVAVPLMKSRMIWYWSLYLQGNDELVKYFATNNHTSSTAKKSSIAEFVSHDHIPNKFKNGEYVPPESDDFGEEGVYESIKKTLLNPDFAPLMRKDLRGLPEAYILISEFDVLRDDGILYGHRLEEAGVKVTKEFYVGTHGMMSDNADYGTFNLYQMQVAVKATNDLVNFVQTHL
ncbi:neutral cholesterol ester hydrolase 1-like [Amphiura filiformis]|uniref:neutral cholesterol ester hydrolase 1-like n=1 Tax=Amphiura filiformis TaxID=82378 RepID=UPI003B20CE0F